VDLSTFNDFPDDARLWIYAFERPLSADEATIVDERLAAFMREWHSHKKDVRGAFAIYHDRFVILCGASRDGISGCSIDSSVQQFKRFRDEHGLNGLNRNLVFYRSGDGEIWAVERANFRREIESGRCGPDTIVFDTTLQTLSDLRADRFELPMRDSWHARAFPSRVS
jgi:hypothetical protein